jgi:hypothetical protein
VPLCTPFGVHSGLFAAGFAEEVMFGQARFWILAIGLALTLSVISATAAAASVVWGT